MIYKSATRNKTIKSLKSLLHLEGDVYLINDHLIESLESHKRMFPESKATTIEEAEQERLEYIEYERKELEALAQQEQELEQEPEE